MNDDDDDKYVYISSEKNKIYYCFRCGQYIIIMNTTTTTTTITNNCPNCLCTKDNNLQTLYIDEAKIYHNPNSSSSVTTKQSNDTVEVRNYSWVYFKCMGSE